MSTAEHGYPMSKYVQSLSDHHLSYEAREMACHFADAYYSRLKGKQFCREDAFVAVVVVTERDRDRDTERDRVDVGQIKAVMLVTHSK